MGGWGWCGGMECEAGIRANLFFREDEMLGAAGSTVQKWKQILSIEFGLDSTPAIQKS